MDGSRFDLLARAVAGGRTRRGFLGGLAALAAGAVGLRGADAACPPGAVAASGGRCICKATGRQPGPTGCPCGAGLTNCSGACLDLSSDRANCGGCGTVCPSGVCRAGVCLKPQSAPCASAGECLTGFCADGVCCGTACTGQCEACTAAGQCLPVLGDPVGGRAACAGSGACAGTCDGNASNCAFPDSTTECLPATCVGTTLTAISTCDGQGSCVAGSVTDCAPYNCGDGACLETCVDGTECSSDYCVEGACCAAADFCFGTCCDPDRAPTETCCPGEGVCCECFHRNDSGINRYECCAADKLCKSLTNSPAADQCCREDEVCVNGDCCWVGKACDGQCCATKCCNGACCAEGDECVVAPGDAAATCQPVRACDSDTDCNTAAGERCATEDDVCCPPERTISFQVPGENGPMTISICCPWGRMQSVQTDSPICCPEPDRCGTSRGSFTRL